MISLPVYFWIGALLLIAVFVIWLIGITRNDDNTYSVLDVACAGSVNSLYPAKIKVKIPNDPVFSNSKFSKIDTSSLMRFIVKGNSMQYAQIKPDDIVYVKPVSISDIEGHLPVVTLLAFTPKSKGKVENKIRQTWKVVNSNITDAEFESEITSILSSQKFLNLRENIGNKCPSNEIMIHTAVESLKKLKNADRSGSVNNFTEEQLLISTTFRTDEDRLEFSIHSSSSLKGIVKYSTRRKL